jgi:hypothetical protein
MEYREYTKGEVERAGLSCGLGGDTEEDSLSPDDGKGTGSGRVEPT